MVGQKLIDKLVKCLANKIGDCAELYFSLSV